MKLLALDSATELCSAALWLDGVSLARATTRPRGSGELILDMIDSLLLEAGLSLRQLDAVAFGRGPGGFTGVRLATAVAQGLGFAAGLPLLPVSDLRALAQQILSVPGMPARALVCQDARLRQVYWGCFQADPMAAEVGPEVVADPENVRLPASWLGSPVCGVGSGFDAYPLLRSRSDLLLTGIRGDLRPRALDIAALAAGDGLAAAITPEAALPVYLRDEVTARPS